MTVIHQITAWSGQPEDETPLCGADRNAVGVWSRRTVAHGAVTCEACKKVDAIAKADGSERTRAGLNDGHLGTQAKPITQNPAPKGE